MDVVFVSPPELHSADLQLWRSEPDPCVRSGKPHEVWNQRKEPECPLWYLSLNLRRLSWSVTFLSCGSYGGAFGSLFPDWRTPTKLWRLSSRYKGGLLSKFRAVWQVEVKHHRFFFVVVKMQITPRVRWCCTSCRWLPWLGPSYKGEAACPKCSVSTFSVVTGFSCFSVSHPDQLLFPPPNWSLSQSLREEQDIGPELQQIYEVQFGCLELLSEEASVSGCWKKAFFLTTALSSWWIMVPVRSARPRWRWDVLWGLRDTHCSILWRWSPRGPSAAPPKT